MTTERERRMDHVVVLTITQDRIARRRYADESEARAEFHWISRLMARGVDTDTDPGAVGVSWPGNLINPADIVEVALERVAGTQVSTEAVTTRVGAGA